MTNRTNVQLCPSCMSGKLHSQSFVYTEIIDKMLLSIPDTSIFVCDICGYHEMDADMLMWLDNMLADSDQPPIARDSANKTISARLSET